MCSGASSQSYLDLCRWDNITMMTTVGGDNLDDHDDNDDGNHGDNSSLKQGDLQ